MVNVSNMSASDQKWMDNYTVFMLFCTTKQRFPKSTEKFNGVNIGNWFMNQRKLYRQNSLDVNKIALLDKISTLWKGSKEDLKLFRNEIIADKIVEYAMENNQTPITEMVNITKQELNKFIERGILTCELILISNNVSMDTKYRALAAIYKDNKLLNYFRLLNEIKEYKSYDELEHDIIIKNLKDNMDEALDTLEQDERKIIILYYGLLSGETMALRDVGDAIGLSHERVRKILNKALQLLRSPQRSIKIICKGSELYEKLIHTKEFKGNDGLDSGVTFKYKNATENRAIYRFEHELSAYLVNILLNNGYNTIGDVIRIPKDKIVDIPNLGPKNASLLEKFIDKYEYLSQ